MSSAAPPQLPDPAQSRAVLIGTSRYQDNDLPDLPEVEPGVHELRALLCDERLWGLPRKNCMVLLNAESPREAQRAIDTAAQAVGSTGTLLVYFSGHGLIDISDELHLGLATTESSAPHSTALPFMWISRSLDDSAARNATVILDCSYAGRAGQVRSIGRTAVLAAAPRNSQARTGGTYTAFTGELLTVLRAGVAGGPELLDLSAIYHALGPRMVEKALPRPVLFSSDAADSYPLVRNLAETVHRVAPTYIQRVHDPALRDHLRGAYRSGKLVVVVGDRASGKTRSAQEAINSLYASSLIRLANTPTLLDEVVAEQIENPTVIWLDDIDQYLPSLGDPIDLARPLKALDLAGSRPVVAIATATTEAWANLLASQVDPMVAETLWSALAVTVESAFFDEELELAAEIAQNDPVIAEALRVAEGGRVIQALAGHPTSASQSASETPAGGQPPVTWEIRTRGYGDRPPTSDLLQREAMIGALADLISDAPHENEKDQGGPTVIALDGAWGMGKTSLIKLVEAKMATTPRPVEQPGEVPRLKVHEADKALSGKGDPLWCKEMVVRASPQAEHTPLIVAKFNPWAHQTSEQVWAGLTTALLDEVDKTLFPRENPMRRNPVSERYWFQSNLDRVDRMRVRRALRKGVLSPVLAVSVLALVVPLIAQMARSVDNYTVINWVIRGSNIALIIAGVALVSGIVHSFWRYRRRNAVDFLPADLFVGPVPSDSKDETLHDPYHNAKSGLLYLAQHDVFKVLNDVKNSNHHVVVFIDDLDRCTPRTTAEVFEAINVFVTNHYPGTRFVLCLDTTTVAAHLDEVYASLKGKALHGDDPTPGWSFLRKLIQLPVAIPPIDPATVPRLLNSLLGEIRRPIAQARAETADVTFQVPQATPRRETVAPALTSDVVTAVAEVLEHDQGVRDLMTERFREQESLSVREAKRMLTIWQYYVRVLVRLGSPDLAEQARHLVIFAEIVARWPAAQRALNRREDGVHGLERLAKASDDWEWAKAVRTLDLPGAPHHKCVKGIRELLERYDGTRVAALASLLA